MKYVVNNGTGGFISVESTWGPDNELNMIPHIAAPGGSIFSTFPLKKGGYATFHGTSMSTPYMSGIVALYLSFKGRTPPLELRNRLVSTADPLDFNNGAITSVGLLAPVPQQGGGSVNAVRFIKATTKISPAFLELNVYHSHATTDCRIPLIFEQNMSCPLRIQPTIQSFIVSEASTLRPRIL